MLNGPDPVGRRSDLRTSFKTDYPPPYVRVCSLDHRVLDVIVFHRRVTDRAALRSQLIQALQTSRVLRRLRCAPRSIHRYL